VAKARIRVLRGQDLSDEDAAIEVPEWAEKARLDGRPNLGARALFNYARKKAGDTLVPTETQFYNYLPGQKPGPKPGSSRKKK
jgi:hypothetical protein